MLQEGAVIKLEGRRDMLSRQKDGRPDVSDDDVCVSLMADLQEEQQTESDKMIEDMAEKVRRPYHALGSLDVVVCMLRYLKVSEATVMNRYFI